MLSFVVFIMIMNAIFYNPILNIMRKREEYINSNYTQAKQYMEQAADFDNQRKVKINETHNRCRENIMNIVDNAHLEANKKRMKHVTIQKLKSLLVKMSLQKKNAIWKTQ